ncbi:MAG: hypothetical protein J0L55_15835, partial [Caulobacterales bacterium]|nr:hypothetical protein [Caulobacterales bacterium]
GSPYNGGISPETNFGLPDWKNTSFTPAIVNINYRTKNSEHVSAFWLIIPQQAAPPSGTSQIEFVVFAAYGYPNQAISNNISSINCAGFYPDSNNYAFPRKTITLSKVKVNYYVPSAASISMSGGSTNGSINFNDANGLKTGEKKSVTLNLNSNQKYKVIMDSAFNGYLNLNNAVGATEKVAYTATLDNETISEATPYQTTVGTSGSTVSKSFEVTIGNTDNARAGWYKDTITLTISPY